MAETKRTHCECCGVCCRKGGPSLHSDDKKLLDEGVLGFGDLITLRAGELVTNQITKKVEPLEQEIVKLRGTGLSWACAQLDTDSNLCKIYGNRPIECEALKCWDTSELEAMYNKDRVTRYDLIPEGHPLQELIDTHEGECPYDRLELAVQGYAAGDPDAEIIIFEMIDFDLNFRAAFRDKTGASEEEAEFLFGRPLHRTIRQFGLDVVTKNGRSVLQPMFK
ncbi:YkgJ family cysteine cluster protein [Desulfobaculum bizertense]|uniref:Putative zinc-or iron-chelating domain-containing protein n=1 Tax=Desulfobaculum bizertense DSM 18034 TaxID=1121442 RepID=A0A1T4WK30_9BACT|nr:YkgJ family cysteine cluster protein [Desulfobaculum bizertense]SKA77268.1 Putative zinc-or iron-chelating domain-containing protein [Desulfobaculum bizertense DSM 18034]